MTILGNREVKNIFCFDYHFINYKVKRSEINYGEMRDAYFTILILQYGLRSLGTRLLSVEESEASVSIFSLDPVSDHAQGEGDH